MPLTTLALLLAAPIVAPAADDVTVIEIGGEPTRCVASADGTWFVVGRFESDDAVQRYDARTFAPGQIYDEEYGTRMSVNALALSPDDRLIAAAGFSCDTSLLDAQREDMSVHERRRRSRTSNTVRVWDAETGTLLHALQTDLHFTTDLAFSADGRRLAAVTAGARLQVWEMSSGREIFATGESLERSSPGCVTFVSEHRVAVASRDDRIRVIDLETGTDVISAPLDDVRALLLDPSGEQLIAQTFTGVHLVDLNSLAMTSSVMITERVPLVHSTRLTPSGRYAVLSHSEPGNTAPRSQLASGIALFDLALGTLSFGSGALPGGTMDADFIVDRRVISVGRSGFLHVWPTFLAEPAWPDPPERTTFPIIPTHDRFDPTRPHPMIASPFGAEPDLEREALIGTAILDAHRLEHPAALPPEIDLHAVSQFLEDCRTASLTTIFRRTSCDQINAIADAVERVLPAQFQAELRGAIDACTVVENDRGAHYAPRADAGLVVDDCGERFRAEHAAIARAACAFAFAHQQQIRVFRQVIRRGSNDF